MKTLNHFKLVLLPAVFFMMAGYAYSYPPDNAAVLYYKVIATYQADDEMTKMLEDLCKDKIVMNDKIKEFVKKNRLIVDTVLEASEIKNCDWGLDFSQGIKMELPHLSNMRKLAYLVIADAKIQAKDGNYDTAISRCVSVYKMARHINDRNYVIYLVGISINALTNNCVMQIMADMPQDTQSLTNLKKQLMEIDSIPFPIKPAILAERECTLKFMTKEQLPDVVKLCEMDESTKKKLLSLDENAISRNRTYFENYYNVVIAAFDMSYLQGCAAFKNLEKKLKEDANSNPDAILTNVVSPSSDKIFSLTTRFKTHNNAIKTAIELYMIKAKTGKLPDTLPADLPGDLFSGKPFIYEKTAEGFILRCQGQDLSKKETYEYKFKVK